MTAASIITIERADKVHATLALALGLAHQEHQFVAHLAELALKSDDAEEKYGLLHQMYAVSLEDGCDYLADLSDEVLRHLELAAAG